MFKNIKSFFCKNKYIRRQKPEKNRTLHILFTLIFFVAYFSLFSSRLSFLFPKNPHVFLPSILLFAMLFFNIFENSSKWTLFYTILYFLHMSIYYFLPALIKSEKQARITIIPQILVLGLWLLLDNWLATCEMEDLKASENSFFFTLFALFPILFLKILAEIILYFL